MRKRKSAQQVAYENGRNDALWKILRGIECRNRYAYSGHSLPFARAWERGRDEVAAELAARDDRRRTIPLRDFLGVLPPLPDGMLAEDYIESLYNPE